MRRNKSSPSKDRLPRPASTPPKRRKGSAGGSPLWDALLSALAGLLLAVCVLYLLLPNIENATSSSNPLIRDHIPPATPLRDFRQQFDERYGGESVGGRIFQDAVHLYGSIDVTAARMLRARKYGRPFVMAFAGYSVTVGRGNYFHQSFPFVVERLLKDPMMKVLGVELIVRNAAIGGIPSFPYGWCLEHFLGADADLISWDYSMNEGNGAAILESYVRQGMSQLPKRPMFLLLDNNPGRKKLLAEYSEQGILPDAISVARANVINSEFLERPDDAKPPGFRNWKEFGAPKSCPGRSSWHPKKQEHEYIGWMISYHMVSAIQRAHAMMREDPDWRNTVGDDPTESLQFPRVMHAPPPNDQSVTEMLYGHPTGFVGDISCRTSFLPASDHEKALSSVVVSGIANTSSLDIMEPRDGEFYKSGWVLDVSKVERETKQKVESCGGLGYVDMKVALYGFAESGLLRLWLPYEGRSPNRHGDDAKEWFNDLVLCEANEKRDKNACQLQNDLSLIVGGIVLSPDQITEVEGAGVYLNRRTCVHVGVPDGAKITRLGDVKTGTGSSLREEDKRRLAGQEASDDDVGLLVGMFPKETVTRTQNSCCLSHIVWEQN